MIDFAMGGAVVGCAIIGTEGLMLALAALMGVRLGKWAISLYRAGAGKWLG